MTENLYHQGSRREYIYLEGRWFWSENYMPGFNPYTWSEMTSYHNREEPPLLECDMEPLPPEKLAEFLAEKLLGNVWEEK